MQRKTVENIGKGIGIVTMTSALILLVGFIGFARIEVEGGQVRDTITLGPLFPESQRDALETATRRIREAGIPLVLVEGPVSACADQNGVLLPCVPGGGLLTGPVAYNGISRTHVAATLRGNGWETAAIPPTIEDDNPDNAYNQACVIAHELLHVLGYGHAIARLGPLSTYPRGHVLTPDALDCGWNFDGVVPAVTLE